MSAEPIPARSGGTAPSTVLVADGPATPEPTPAGASPADTAT
ncbi:hypothetical protein ACFFU6_01110 [Streptomyces antimycoticus]